MLQKHFLIQPLCLGQLFLLGLMVIGMSAQGGDSLQIGAQQTSIYGPLLKKKNVALVVNQTSKIGEVHLVDSLLRLKIKIKKIFAPEHGFRGHADAGQQILDGVDPITKLPIVSLYGKNKKPTPAQLKNIDVVVFDIQDVGTRFYTYISTMHYVMQACSEQNIKFVVLDRPNPNDGYIDGPVRKEKFKSFVGMHPIPIVHALTVGELATMINGEGWLEAKQPCDLTVIKMKGYRHGQPYQLPIKPSPNLPNQMAIKLYPSLCLFEGPKVSIGRGTTYPFQVIGYPDPKLGNFQFTPKSIEGMAKHPKLLGQQCFGDDLRRRKPSTVQGIELSYLIKYYDQIGGDDFFTSFFNLLAGTDELRLQIEAGLDEEEIKVSWQEDLIEYRKLRKKYLLYPDF